jgi:hypothetical protein
MGAGLSLWATDSLLGVALEGRREDWRTARRGVKVAKFKA